jgi:hypothetical protein
VDPGCLKREGGFNGHSAVRMTIRVVLRRVGDAVPGVKDLSGIRTVHSPRLCDDGRVAGRSLAASVERLPGAAVRKRLEAALVRQVLGMLENWLGGRDSEPFAACVSTSRCFPRDVPSRQNERAESEGVLAGRQGFEPRYRGPEPRVLPLDDLPVPVAATVRARTVDYSRRTDTGQT